MNLIKQTFALILLISCLAKISAEFEIKRLENELERQIQAQIQLLNSSSLLEEDKSGGPKSTSSST